MNTSKTPKIVVGVGLVAIYATAAAFFMPHSGHDSVVAQNPPSAIPAPIANSVAPLPVIPQSAGTPAPQDALTSQASSPAPAPAPKAPDLTTAARAPETPRPRVAVEPAPRAEEVPAARVAAVTPAARSDAEESNLGNSGGDAVSEPAVTADAVDAKPVPAADAPAGKDSQITADVKSRVAAVAPGGAIDVTTRDGVVELAGSVPSQDVLEKARLAASNVRDVRGVDASALTVSD